MAITKVRQGMNLFPPALSDFFDTDGFFTPGWFTRDIDSTMPPVNIRENGKEFTVEVAAPGYDKEDFKLEINANVLTIRAEKSKENEQKDERFTRKEFAYNAFTRSFTLPETVRSEKIEAKYADGILRLMIPKDEAVLSKKHRDIMVN